MRLSSRRALTLIELVVVLLVLAALAGTLVPIFTDFTTRTHGAAGADNIVEITKAVQIYRASVLRDPDNLDRLLDNAGAAVDIVPSGSGEVTTLTLDANTAGALTAVGITTLHNMVNAADTENATFDPYDGTTPTVAVADTVVVSGATGAAVAREFGARLPATATYAIFGLGSNCDMVGKGMVEAPIHFPEAGSPAAVYSRFNLVYQLTDAAGTAFERAKFVGVVALNDEGELRGLGHHLEEYYEAAAE